MMTEYKFITQLITTDKELGNFLANLCSAYPDDPGAELGTFSESRMCNPPAFWAEVHCKESLADVIRALKNNAEYLSPELEYLRERGLTAEQWAQAKSIITASVYQYLQDDGTKTPDHNAINTLAAANGYVIVEPAQ